MAELLPSERLQPCLLDRLTDNKPHQNKEGRDERVVSMRAYRSAVLRDLEWLLNTSNLSNVDDISEHEEVERSVVNFGMPDLCGKTVSGLDPMDVEERLVRAIRDFEPRILPHTLNIKSMTTPDPSGGTVVSFEVEGELWAYPMSEALYIKTELDLETGDFVVRGDSR
ncbi:MAG: type VI secretion system baseplate subunit TssE [Planctomycetota bacterium]